MQNFSFSADITWLLGNHFSTHQKLSCFFRMICKHFRDWESRNLFQLFDDILGFAELSRFQFGKEMKNRLQARNFSHLQLAIHRFRVSLRYLIKMSTSVSHSLFQTFRIQNQQFSLNVRVGSQPPIWQSNILYYTTHLAELVDFQKLWFLPWISWWSPFWFGQLGNCLQGFLFNWKILVMVVKIVLWSLIPACLWLFKRFGFEHCS